MKIAAIQMVSGPEIDANLVEAARLIAQAAEEGAKLAVLPEYFPMIGARDVDRLEAREAEGSGPIQDFLSGMARRHRLWIVGGSLPLHAENTEKSRNTCFVYDDFGLQRARYDKIHLFSFENGAERYEEGLCIEAGEDVSVCDTPFGKMGIAICYDLRFPELFRKMGEVALIVVPAAFTQTTGLAHWELLLRSRAVENQCYVIASAQGGLHPTGRRTYGNSMIVDPWGEIVARMDKGAGIIMAQFDASRIVDVRSSLPALRHRKL
ncbi:MAG: carbon-nitrogen hydrolase family protein [Burkholderiales bacterium]|nr:carbon-nitrogen hydrolase family protein [Burkholderiales bacterium]